MLFILSILIIGRNADFKLNKNVEIVFFGHSHAQCTYNDSIIQNSKNMAQSAESYFYTYIKLKQILAQNKNIKTFFIEFSNNQIDIKMDKWIWGKDIMPEKLSNYLPFMGIKDVKYLYSKNHTVFKNSLPKAFRKNLAEIILFDYNFTQKTGGYRKLERIATESEINQGQMKFYGTESIINEHQLSNANMLYLEKIIKCCIQNNIKVFLIRSPHHKYYEFLKNENQYLMLVNTRFQGVELLDFNEFPLANDEFADISHLNFSGSINFSKFFQKLIDNGLLNKKDKQKYINSQLDHYKN